VPGAPIVAGCQAGRSRAGVATLSVAPPGKDRALVGTRHEDAGPSQRSPRTTQDRSPKIKAPISDYDEIRKEMKLALQECGRKLATYLRRRKRMQRQLDVRDVLVRYIGEVANGCEGITGTPAKKVYDALMKQVKRKTAEADAILNEEGKVVARIDDDDVVIVEDRAGGGGGVQESLFEEDAPKTRKKRITTRTKTKTRRKKVA